MNFRKLIGLTCIAAAIGLGSWQLSVESPVLPRAVTGMLLFLIGTLAGLRIGYEAARGFMEDARRMNRVILDQNSDLVELNQRLLRELLQHCAATSEPHE